MTDPKDHFLSWLRDAHAGEEQAVTMLNGLAKQVGDYPELKARVEQHAVESERHGELIRECLQHHDSDVSMLKETGTKLMGLGQGVSGMFTSDNVAKGILAGYSFEHMEIASYKMLIAAAHKIGDVETARVCEEILQDELAMAKWLEDHLEEITGRFLDLEAR